MPTRVSASTFRDLSVDVLVHPYWMDHLRPPETFPAEETDEKTKRWKSAIGELGNTDYLVFVAGDPLKTGHYPLMPEDEIFLYPQSAQKVRTLTSELFDYAQERLGDHVISYINAIDAWLRFHMRNPGSSQIKRLQGYGEVFGRCVNFITEDVRRSLCVPKSNVIIPLELSVSSTGRLMR